MITDLQSEHFVDEKGALFPGALLNAFIIRLATDGGLDGRSSVQFPTRPRKRANLASSSALPATLVSNA
ncbi:hypothetical protein X748_28070 [Mesorhizobium sp. LNJC386A00]|nr:hypothetical protein X748_28070 [Mesorhizobium sp. LNJC386A00]